VSGVRFVGAGGTVKPYERFFFWAASLLGMAGVLFGARVHAQTVTCDGTCTFSLTLDAATAIEQVRVATVAVLADPSVLGITSGNIAAAVAFGLGFILLMWFAGYIVAVAKTGIGKL
jgi:hypothetical protein